MRDRLIELIKSSSQYVNEQDSLVERIADHFLANGVIVLPYKVGDTVYYIPFGDYIVECVVAQIVIEPFAEIGFSFHCYGGIVFDMRFIGKTVFSTREEAEQALKGENK